MKNISRRNFLRTSFAIGGTAVGAAMLPQLVRAGIIDETPDIISIPSGDPMSGLPQALEPFGGIGSFIRQGQSVGFLVNSPWVHPGYYTHPDIVLSMMKLCKDAGAGRIVCYKPVREDYWQESRFYDQMQPLISEIEYGEERVIIDIPEAKLLKSAEVFRLFPETDVFINMPVAKHHNGTLFSGVLKGLMGVSSRDTNRHMHSPDGEYTYEKEEHLAGCIADLNLIRRADLLVMDAGICAVNNGPRGPGDTVSPQRILTGKDPLAMDVYASSLIGMDPADILTFQKANEHGMGKADLASILVKTLD